MNISIKKPSIEEWEQYKELRLFSLKECPTAFGSSYEETKNKPDEYWKSHINSSQSNNESTMFVAFDQDKMVGMMVSRWEDRSKTKHIAHINGVYVLPEYRGKGVAKRLFNTSLEHLKSMNRFRKIVLDVTTKNKPAYGFYLKQGFKDVGTNHDEIFFDNEYYDTSHMELFL